MPSRMGANTWNLKRNPADPEAIFLQHHLMSQEGIGREREFGRIARPSLSGKEVLEASTVT